MLCLLGWVEWVKLQLPYIKVDFLFFCFKPHFYPFHPFHKISKSSFSQYIWKKNIKTDSIRANTYTLGWNRIDPSLTQVDPSWITCARVLAVVRHAFAFIVVVLQFGTYSRRQRPTYRHNIGQKLYLMPKPPDKFHMLNTNYINLHQKINNSKVQVPLNSSVWWTMKLVDKLSWIGTHTNHCCI